MGSFSGIARSLTGKTAFSLFPTGAYQMLISAFFFALMNVCVKLLPEIPTHEIVFFRSATLFTISVLLLCRYRLSPLGNQRKALFLRGLYGTLALSAYFFTLKHIPLASAVTIQYLNPIFATVFAIFVLQEAVKPLQWACFGLSLSGVVLIKGFDPRISGLYLLTGLFAAACSGLSYNYVRKLRHSDHALVVIFYFAWVNLALMGPYTALHWQQPQGWAWLWLILVGLFTYLAQLFMTWAYHAERMAVVANLNYSGVIYALLFGSLIFGEQLHWPALIGMLLIVTGVILSSLYRSLARSPKPLTKAV